METVFESDRILFNKISLEYVDDYLSMVNDYEVNKYISKTFKTYTYIQEVEWVKEKIKDNSLIFTMIEKNTNEFIGNIELMHVNLYDCTLGIAIITSKQHKGYGSEAIKRLIKYVFEELKLSEIKLEVFSDNERAIKCYTKLGFKEYNRNVSILERDNKIVDEICMKLEKNYE